MTRAEIETLPGAPVLTTNHLRLRIMDRVMYERGTINLHEFMRLTFNSGFRMPWLDPRFDPKF